MKYKAKRISAGSYEYRGWHIDKDEAGIGAPGWCATKAYQTDRYTASTLSIAKDLIDHFEANREKAANKQCIRARGTFVPIPDEMLEEIFKRKPRWVNRWTSFNRTIAEWTTDAVAIKGGFHLTDFEGQDFKITMHEVLNGLTYMAIRHPQGFKNLEQGDSNPFYPDIALQCIVYGEVIHR